MVKSKGALFKPKWTMTVLVMAAVLVFVFLARWQWHRAGEKQALLDWHARQLAAPVLALRGDEDLHVGELRYRRVVVTGIWDSDHQLLWDNRIWRGRAGYEVLTPLEIEGSRRLVLINRGWVAACGDRSRLPEVSLPRQRVTVRGIIDHFPQPAMLIPGMELPTRGWPAVVGWVDPQVVSQLLGQEVMNFQIKLAPDMPEGYVRQWQLDFINPHQNIGYAIQWASFALIALWLWIWHGWQRARKIRIDRERHD